jgi:hypothetical protein
MIWILGVNDKPFCPEEMQKAMEQMGSPFLVHAKN